MVQGTLYVVASPLGHLGDLSERAAATLRSVGLVAAEDTRRTRTLLKHLEATPRVLSFHAHAPAGRVQALLGALSRGTDVALVTDAGTPGVSDPGPKLVAAVLAAGGRVVPIPGPSAVTALLSASGFPADRFTLLGFLPRRGTARKRALVEAASSPHPVVIFEAPARLTGLLNDLADQAGPDRTAVVGRELTKRHEEIRRDTIAGHLQYWHETGVRGEVTVVLEGAPRTPPAAPTHLADEARALIAEGWSRRDAARELVRRHGVPRNDAYRVVEEVT